MNESESYREDLHQADESEKHIYSELSQPQPDIDDSNKNVYYELHRFGDQGRSSQQQSPSSFNQLVISKMVMVFLVLSLLLILLVLGILLLLTAVILIKMTTTVVPDSVTAGAIHVNQIENNISQLLTDSSGLLENITESVMSLHHLVNQQQCSSKNINAVNLIQQSSKNTTQKLINIVSTLNNLKGTSISTAGVVDDILLVVEELLEIQNASVLLNSLRPISCNDIKTVLPNSPTGYYHVNSRNVYCHMGELCGTEGGWTRLAYLDMSDSTVNCPTGFKLYESNGVRACGRETSSVGSCQSVKFSSNGIVYSQVCGRVVGYQYVSPSAVDARITDINSYYLDGISITHGSPRKHIWSFMAGFEESQGDGFNCPCSNGSTQTIVQSFIGNDYFCESGNPQGHQSNNLFTQDPLWDGKGCDSLEVNCCSAPGLPWFNKIVNSTTTDYIELRVCCDQSTDNEDVPVSFYEIYIKQ